MLEGELSSSFLACSSLSRPGVLDGDDGLVGERLSRAISTGSKPPAPMRG
jgi:hypothetical protein